jgi:hypothetical protein
MSGIMLQQQQTQRMRQQQQPQHPTQHPIRGDRVGSMPLVTPAMQGGALWQGAVILSLHDHYACMGTLAALQTIFCSCIPDID